MRGYPGLLAASQPWALVRNPFGILAATHGINHTRSRHNLFEVEGLVCEVTQGSSQARNPGLWCGIPLRFFLACRFYEFGSGSVGMSSRPPFHGFHFADQEHKHNGTGQHYGTAHHKGPEEPAGSLHHQPG